MRHSGIKLIPIIAFAILGVIPAISGTPQRMNNPWKPDIPKTWDDEAMRSLELPLANAANSPKHISADYYYSMPVRPVFQSYPIYYPDREPRGYLDSLRNKEPQIIFDASRLKTEEDWIKAGEIVFDAPIEFISQGLLFSEVRDKAWYDKNKVPVRKDGVFPFMRYIIREKGKIEVGILACASCHSRVMPDGSVLKGVQGNFPDDRTFAYESRLEAAQGKDENEVLKEVRSFMRRAYSAPWVTNDPNAQPEGMSLDEIASVLEATIPGICARQGSSAFYPPRIPDLIGVKDRLYLDSSGLVRHRTIGDLMRYAALNQGADYLSLYGTFRPKKLPDPSTESRYSDEQLYALALYVYSLKPPPNPNPFDALARKGQEIFKQEGCASCHTPPLYTNNKLTPAAGFQVPPEHLKKYDVLAASVGTDPRLTLQTRRGTGYYKVPSLKGVWYRGPFEHNGSVATLEDWFDPRRLRDDYVPTGFRGYGVTARAVKGHPFGLDLSGEDRKALIAFLKTL
jgi:hypothetical protein